MTVAKDIVRRHNCIRLTHAVAGSLLALALIIGGIYLTQRQLDKPTADAKQEEVSIKLHQVEINARSTYPGITLIVCGTAIACSVLLKRYRAKTQHQDDHNPGFTEVEN